MKTFNGHKNYNHWNVSLWINNDEGLYKLAKFAIHWEGTKERAAEYMLMTLGDNAETPDGVKYTKSSIRAALVGL